MTNFFEQADSPAAPTSPDSAPESPTTTETGNFFAQGDEPEGPQPGLVEDLVTHTRSAFVSSYGADAKALGLITGNEWLEDKGDYLFKVSDEISQNLSRDAVEGQQKSFVEDSDVGRTRINMRGELVSEYSAGEAWGDIDSWNSLIGSAIGSLGAVVTGGGITKLSATVAGRSIGKAVGRQAARKKAVEEALKEGGEEAAKAVLKKQAAREATKDSVIGTLAYGVNEGLMVGGSAAKDVEDFVMDMPGDTLSQAPLFQEVYWSLRDELKMSHEQAFEEARTTTAKSLGTTAVYRAGIPSVLLGAVAGRYLNKALTGKLEGSRAMRAGKGFVTEASTEGGQGAVEHLATGYTKQEADADVDPYKGLANAAVSEALGGGIAGAGLGAASPSGVEGEVKSRKAQNKADAADIEAEIQALEEAAEYEQSLEAARQQIMPNFDMQMPLDGGTKVEAGSAPEGTVDFNPYAQDMQPLDVPAKKTEVDNGIDFEAPAIEKPEAAGLSLQPKEQQGEGIPYDPPSRTEILAGKLQDKIERGEREADAESLTEQANFFEQNDQVDSLPEAEAADTAEKQGLSRRFGSPSYRGAVESLTKDLVKGGDVSYVRDEHDRITGRTGSVNPEWFQSNDDMGSVDYVQKTVEKALKGEKLGKRQQRVVEALMDAYESENQFDQEQEGEYGAFDPADDSSWYDEQGRFKFDPADGHGARTYAMLEEEALDAGVSRETLTDLVNQKLPLKDHAEALYAEIKRANPRGNQPGASEVPGREGAQARREEQARDGEAAPSAQRSETEGLSDTGDTDAVTPQEASDSGASSAEVTLQEGEGDTATVAPPKVDAKKEIDGLRDFLVRQSDSGRLGASDVNEAVDIATIMASDHEIDDELWTAINRVANRNPAGVTAKADGRKLEGLNLSDKEAAAIRDRILKAAESPHAVDSRGYSESLADSEQAAEADTSDLFARANGKGFVSEKALKAALKGKGLNLDEYRISRNEDGDYIARKFRERKVPQEEKDARQAAVDYISWQRSKGAGSLTELEPGVYQGRTFLPGDKAGTADKISKSGILVDNRFKFPISQLWKASVEQKAAEIESGANEADTSPTEAQKEAGNYKKGRISFNGIKIGIENPAGSMRSGTSPDGKKWENRLFHHYGDITGVTGADGDQLDVFVNSGANAEESRKVFVIDQTDADGAFDEHKVMLGFRTESAAINGYKSNYDAGWKVGPVTEMTLEEFQEWIDEGDTTQPLSAELREGGGKTASQKEKKSNPPKSTAPEHASIGVDERELSQIVAEFDSAMDAQRATGVHHQFDHPEKSEITRLGQKSKVYHKEHGWMTPAEAKKVIAELKANAKKQGDNPSTNAHRIVLSLFDLTGSWSKPWEEAGYQVFRFDIQDDPEVGDINNFSSEFFGDWFGDFEGQDIYAILAACPCTDFASSGARHFAAKDKDGRTVASVNLVHQTLRTIEYFKPSIWALENPVGRIEKLGGLPPWRLSFDPNDLGDNYTKKTLIWGNFNSDLPIAPVEPTEGSKMHRLYGGKSLATKNARSATPEGFSYGFFAANNAVDHPILEAAGKYDRLDRDLLQKALDAGMTMADIDAAVEDAYYMDLDDAAAESALEDAIAEFADGGKPDERRDTAQHEIYSRRTEDMGEAELREYVEQLRSEILTDERTGLGSNRAWIQRKPKKFVASIDLDSLKWINDNMGHGAGDSAIALVGEALRQGGIGSDSYHVSGDEFYAQADDFSTLTKALNRARKWLGEQSVSGNGIDFKGPAFSFGIARDLHEAENNLQKDKSKREQDGTRAGRGERPSGAVDAGKRSERDTAEGSGKKAAGDGAAEVTSHTNRFDTPVELIQFRQHNLPREAGPYGHDQDGDGWVITQQRYDAAIGEFADVKLTDKELTDLVNNKDSYAAREAKRREREAEAVKEKQAKEDKRNAARTRKMRGEKEVRRPNGEPFTNKKQARAHLEKWKLGATHYVDEILWRPHPHENARKRYVLTKLPEAPLGKVDVRYETYRDGKGGYFDMVSIAGDLGGFEADIPGLYNVLDIKDRKPPSKEMAEDSYDGAIDRSARTARVSGSNADQFFETVELLQMSTPARIQAMYDEEVSSEIGWTKRSPKSWRSDDGQIIADHSFSSGGSRVKSFMVYANEQDYHDGRNYASGETLTEAKSKAKPADLLSSYTEKDLQQRDKDTKTREQLAEARKRSEESKAKADKERDDFALTGSDRAADVAAARGQNSLFDASGKATEEKGGDLFDRRDPAIEAMLGKIKESRPDISQKRDNGPGYTMDWDKAPWIPAKNGFEARSYVKYGKPYAEIKSPEGNIVTKSLAADGSIVTDVEGTLDELLSGAAFDSFNRYFQPEKKAKAIASTASKPEESGRRAKPGGEYGLNGEWYTGGQFMPASAFTVKGEHKVHGGKASATKKALVEPGKLEEMPKDAMPIFQRVSMHVDIDVAGKLSVKTNLPDVAFDTHFENGKAEVESLVDFYNEGARFLSDTTADGPGEVLKRDTNKQYGTQITLRKVDDSYVIENSAPHAKDRIYTADANGVYMNGTPLNVKGAFNDAAPEYKGTAEAHQKAMKLAAEEQFALNIDDSKAASEARNQMQSLLKAKPNKPAGKLEDTGEKLGGARKDMEYTTTTLEEGDFSSEPFSKIWPKNAYQDVGNKFVEAYAYAARAAVPSKPRKSYKVERWIEKVESLRDSMLSVARMFEAGTLDQGELLARMRKYVSLDELAVKIQVLNAIDKKHWDRVESARISHGVHSYRTGPDGKREATPKKSALMLRLDGRPLYVYGEEGKQTEVEALLQKAEFIEAIEGTDNQGAATAKDRQKFEIRGSKGYYAINRKGDKEYRPLKSFAGEGALTEARQYLNNNIDELFQAWEDVKARHNVSKADVRALRMSARSGTDYRDGRDVAPEEFMEVFGFRGVEFGNWVKQGKAGKDRQGFVNQAYDALLDLSKLLNIPPETIALNANIEGAKGLGLAFGSRGKGKAAAHYEAGSHVINLTKTSGAGTLAHEWFHALDSYFQGHRDDPSQGIKDSFFFVTQQPETYYRDKVSGTTLPAADFELMAKGEGGRRGQRFVMSRFNADNWVKVDGVRPEVELAFYELVKVLDASPMKGRARLIDKGKADGYWSRIIERAARSFENYVVARMEEEGIQNDFLASFTKIEDFGRDPERYPYLLPEEMAPVKEAFDKLFETIASEQTERGTVLYSLTDNVSYRIGGNPVAGVPAKAARKVVNRLQGRMGVDAEVVDSWVNLPDHLRKSVLVDGVENKVRGLYDETTGKAYIVAGNLRDEKDAATVYLHEVLGHKGLRAAVGKKLDVVLTQLYKDMPEAERTRLEAKYRRQLKGKPPAEAKRILADEYVAHLAERDPSNGLLRRVISMVRNWLRDTFKAFGGMHWTESDVIELLQSGRREMAKGAKAGKPGAARYEQAQRPVVADSDLLAGWTLLTQDDDVFQLPTSGANTIEGVFAEVSNLKVEEAPELAMQADGEPENGWRVNTDRGEVAAIYEKGDSVWIDVSDLKQGSDGREVYNAVANYAYNTGKVFIGDPAGLSDVASSRRLEQMLSSALKFGTTDHLWPHPKQELGFAGVPGIKWKDGNFTHNVEQMIQASYRATLEQFPEIANLIYNPASGEFENKETGRVWRDREFQQLAALGRKRLAEADREFFNGAGRGPAPNPVTAGRTTLERAVITHSLSSRQSREGRLRLLASLSERSPRFKGILYSLTDEDTEVALDKLGLGREQRRGLRALINKFKLINFREAWTGLKERAYEGVFDGLVGIKRAEDSAGVGIGAGDYESSGYVGARLASGIADTMHAILHYGAPKWGDGVIEHKEGTEGLLEVLGELGPDLREWLGWMGGKRAQELKAQGRENNLSNDDIDMLLALRTTENAAKFDLAQKKYAKLNKAMLDLAEGAGLIDPDSRKKWESEWYIPFYRQDVDGDGLLAPRTKRGLSHQSAGIKALRGSEVATNDLLQNLLTNWMKLADASMKNMALLKTVDNLKDTDYFTNESLKYTQAIIPKAEVVKRIKADRNYLEMVGEMMGLFDAGQLEILHELNKLDTQGFEKLWAITAPRDPDVIRVQRGGKNEYYKVNDPALLRGLVHLNNEGIQNLLMKGARGLKRLLTTGVTAAPDFMMRNMFRDAFHAWAINKDKDADGKRQFKFGTSSLEGLKRAFQEDPDYRELMFANASFQGGYIHGTDPDAAAAAIRRALRKKGLTPAEVNDHMDTLIDKGINLGEKGFAKVMRGWEAYRGVGDKLENTNRLATFKAAKRAGKSLAQAVFESKDLMDYSLRGNWTVMNVFTDIVPFLNARLQGLSKLVRAAELSGEPHKPWTWRMDPMMGKAVAQIVFWSAALALLNDDNEEYNALPDWEKDAYWHIFIGGEHFRMPKPFEIGIIAGTIPERIMHAWVLENQPDDKVLWSLKHGTLETLSFNPTPQALVPVFELWGNRSFFFDTPIESMSDKRLMPQDRYNAFTSRSAVWLGQLTGTSPKQLQHVWEGYTGTMGAYALWGMDALVGWAQGRPNTGTIQPTDIPVLKSFWRGDGPARSTQYTTDLYNRLKESSQLVASFKQMQDPIARRAFMQEHGDKMGTQRMLSSASRTLSQLRKQQKRLLEDPNMPAREKQRQLDDIQRRINQVAKQASEQSEFAF